MIMPLLLNICPKLQPLKACSFQTYEWNLKCFLYTKKAQTAIVGDLGYSVEFSSIYKHLGENNYLVEFQ